MELHKAIALPSIALLPPSDPGFRRAIDDVALLASGLIASVDAAILTIAVPSDRWGDTLPLVAWNQRLAADPDLSHALIEQPMFAPAFDALCMATDAVFARLDAWRWIDVDMRGLCLVTDGATVILSTERPSADADCNWLLDLARSDGGSLVVRTSDTQGIWSLIAAQASIYH